MGFIEKRNGRYRARYRDPLGHQRCETFSRKVDAERFLREQQVDSERGRWIDPHLMYGIRPSKTSRRMCRISTPSCFATASIEISAGSAPSGSDGDSVAPWMGVTVIGSS